MAIYTNSHKIIPAASVDKVCDLIVANVAINDNDCWIWNGSRFGAGYGRIKLDGQQFYAHRVSAQLFHPTFDPTLLVCHECPNRHDKACVNPWHLVQGTQKYNMSNDTTRALISQRTIEAHLRMRHSPNS